MASASNAIQKGIYDRLTGYGALTAQLASATAVYDHVPQGSEYPFVVIGDDTALFAGTKSTDGQEFTITIHAWAKGAGRKVVKAILIAIRDALHQQESNITVTGFQLVLIQCEFEQTFQDPSEPGDTDHYYHGIQRFRAIVRG